MNCVHLERRVLNVEIMGQGYAWLDTGTHDSMLNAAEFVRVFGEAAGRQDREPGGNRLPPRVHRRHGTGQAIAGLGESVYARYLKHLLSV